MRVKSVCGLVFFWCLSGSLQAADEVDSYGHWYEKCQELIEMSRSPAKNWTTSRLEALAAGECLAAMEIIPQMSESNRSHYRRACSGINTLPTALRRAEVVVAHEAKSIDDVEEALCN